MTFRRRAVPEMYLLAALLITCTCHAVRSQEQAEHRDFQYNSAVDPLTGRYNFAYDTGNEGDNEIAHAMHMQYRDANGIVRGRYGYTDPRGKLRVVEYEAGPKGFVARGDTGPDQSLHDQSPATGGPEAQLESYRQEDLDLDPRPVQMAGWDPEQNPMGQTDGGRADGNLGSDGFVTANDTGGYDVEAYLPVFDLYNDRYPRLTITTSGNADGSENVSERELESQSSSQPTPSGGDSEKPEEPNSGEKYPVASPETVNSIDVNPDDIRQSASGQSGTVARSADGSSSSSSSLPYSYRNYRRPTHDHDGEIAYPFRSVYVPSHGHYHYVRQPHDHDAERRRYYYNYYRPTHDHDAERRTHDHDADWRRHYYYVSRRQTHDHDAEKKTTTSSRQTHDHDAEKRYYTNRQTHDHEAEKANSYHSAIHRQNNPHRRRIFYRDSHSMVPHEHYSDIYHNHNDREHRHSDIHLYGNSQVPPTARPGNLKYISSDKYHDKYYYWTD